MKCDWCPDEAVKFFRCCRNYYNRGLLPKQIIYLKVCLSCSQAVGFGFDFKEQLSEENWVVSQTMDV